MQSKALLPSLVNGITERRWCLQAYMSIVLVILLAIVVLSFVPLAGRRGGWAQYAMNNITTDLMVQLGLAPWDHYVDVGYIQVTPQQRPLHSYRAGIFASLPKHNDGCLIPQVLSSLQVALLSQPCKVAGSSAHHNI